MLVHASSRQSAKSYHKAVDVKHTCLLILPPDLAVLRHSSQASTVQLLHVLYHDLCLATASLRVLPVPGWSPCRCPSLHDEEVNVHQQNFGQTTSLLSS